ncbi:TSET complex member tstF [Picochlorum sp. SENEW3]|nr:TSET complex member tstF [Picochlorum sp. SENEW3]
MMKSFRISRKPSVKAGNAPQEQGDPKDVDTAPREEKEEIPKFLAQDVNAGGMSILKKKATTDKVERLVFHPTNSMVAVVDRGAKVMVWDYEADDVVYINQAGGVDEGAIQEILLRKKAERHSALINDVVQEGTGKAKNDFQYQMKSVPSGRVNDIAFLDRHTCLWQQGYQESLGGNSLDSCRGISDLQQGDLRELGKHCWLITATENKVSFHDMASSSTADFSRQMYFESKEPTKLAVLVYNSLSLVGRQAEQVSASAAQHMQGVSPLVAVGTSSGSIYLLHVGSGTVVAKCSGAHGKPITCLQTIGPAHPGGPDRLVSGSADGTIAIWDPSRSAKTFDKGSASSIQPVKSFKAHDGGIFDMGLFGLQVVGKNGLLAVQPYIASVGADKQLCAWNASTWNRDHMPLQVLPKDCLVSVGSTMRAGIGLGSTMPLVGVSDKSCCVFALDPKESKFNVLINVESMIDKGDKKRPKIYRMAVSPSKPSIVGLATNTSVVILKDYTSAMIPSSVSLVSQNMFSESYMKLKENSKPAEEEEAEGEKEPIRIPPGLLSINVVDGKLVSSLYKMDMDKNIDSKDRTMHLENVGSLILANLDFPVQEDTRIESSPSGRYISVVWPKLNQYSVYGYCSKGIESSWRLIDSGEGSQLVWSTTAPIYAVLKVASVPLATAFEPAPMQMMYSQNEVADAVPSVPAENQDKDKDVDTTEDATEPAQPEERIVPEERTVPTQTELDVSGNVIVHAIEDSEEPKYIGSSEISLGDGQPVKIFGGSLLGISASEPSSKPSLRFFSWVDFSPVGSNIPSPNWISWDPESTMCALGYDSSIQMCAVYPHFHCFASLGIGQSESAFWQPRQLYVSTPTSINAIFTDSRESYVEVICLADFNGQNKGTQSQKQGYVFGHKRLRPSGPVRLVGTKHSYLVVQDSLERPFLVSLRSYGLRSRSVAAKGDIDTAVTLAAKYVRPVLHDGTAQCLLAMGSDRDFEKVLNLPGLSPEMRISIAIRHGDWHSAARAFQAHSLGVNDTIYSNLINEHVEALSPSTMLQSPMAIGERNMAAVSNILEEEAAAYTFEDKERMQGSDTASEAYSSASSSEAEDVIAEEEEEEYVDPIDWNSWRETEEETEEESQHTDGMRDRSIHSSVPILDRTEIIRILESVDLGLELSSIALDGHGESARQILSALLAYSSSISQDRLETLVDHMVMCNMTESLRNLWSVTSSTSAASQNASVASILAASIGGLRDTNMVESLKDAGLYPLAFLYAAVWGQGNPDHIESLWREQLRHYS